MSPERFEQLLGLLGPRITKKKCRARTPISAAERLMITLRYLAEGDRQQSQSLSFRMGRSAVSNIVRDVTGAIWEVLKNEYLATPTTTEQWLKIANTLRMSGAFHIFSVQ